MWSCRWKNFGFRQVVKTSRSGLGGGVKVAVGWGRGESRSGVKGGGSRSGLRGGGRFGCPNPPPKSSFGRGLALHMGIISNLKCSQGFHNKGSSHSQIIINQCCFSCQSTTMPTSHVTRRVLRWPRMRQIELSPVPVSSFDFNQM